MCGKLEVQKSPQSILLTDNW